jgi:hypothetical protein
VTLLAIKNFGGLAPKVEPEQLPENGSVVANNARIISGAVEPWRTPNSVVTLTSASPVTTIYKYGQNLAITDKAHYWFQFTTDVNVVKGPVAADTEERTYWTDGVYPKKGRNAVGGSGYVLSAAPYPSSSLRMGVPPPGFNGFGASPTYTPSVAVSGTATDPTSTAISSCYVVTFVSSWGEESGPTTVSNIVTWRDGQTLTVTLPGAAPSGAYDITKVRLYRSNSGTAATNFQYVTAAGDLPVTTTSYADTSANSTLGTVIESWNWDPPLDTLFGLTDMGNGIMAAFVGNTVYFCEPGVPYAWPQKYAQAMNSPVVGLGSFDQSLFVGCTRECYVITGVDPSTVTVTKISNAPSCASKRSIVEMNSGVVYAGPDGLWFISAAGAYNVTESVMSRDEWQTYAPSSMIGNTLDGRYYCFYNNGTTSGGLIFQFAKTAAAQMSVGTGMTEVMTATDQTALTTYRDKLTDTLYIVQSAGGTSYSVLEWHPATGSSLTMTWQSKPFRYEQGINFARARVMATAYPVTFKLVHDGSIVYTYSVPNSTTFPLPSLDRAIDVSVVVSGTSRVKSVWVGTSAEELAVSG